MDQEQPCISYYYMKYFNWCSKQTCRKIEICVQILTDNFGEANGEITVCEPVNILEFVVSNKILLVLLGELVLTKEKVLPAVVTFRTGGATVVTGDSELVKLYAIVVETVDTAVSA